MERFRQLGVIAVAARWGAWAVSLALLGWSGALTQPAANLSAWLAFAYVTLYAVLWTRLLPRIVQRVSDGSIILLYDLLLSLLPVWLSGGWRSPFLPFALSVLILPTVSRGLRAGLLLASIFLAIDQIGQWSAPLLFNVPSPLDLAYGQVSMVVAGRDVVVSGAWLLLARTLIPFVLVASVVGLQSLGRRRGAPGRRVYDSAAQSGRAAGAPRPPSGAMRLDASAPYRRPVADESPARSWPRERGPQSTVARRTAPSIEATLRIHQAELEAAGIKLIADLDANEQRVPPPLRDLLIRSLEVALDNVLSHSRAGSVVVALRIGQEWALLRVVDDGIGLFDGTAEPPGFHQLKRLRFRVEEIGGALRVDEGADGGVVLEVRVPLTV